MTKTLFQAIDEASEELCDYHFGTSHHTMNRVWAALREEFGDRAIEDYKRELLS